VWRQAEIRIATRGRGYHDLTTEVGAQVRACAIQTGICHLFLRHTSASLCITENADPEVRRDLERFAQRLAPDGDPMFRHDAEGPDDMPAHVRSLVIGCELTLPIRVPVGAPPPRDAS
jgi:secondary thiamine-phosphate synthase enzyme